MLMLRFVGKSRALGFVLLLLSALGLPACTLDQMFNETACTGEACDWDGLLASEETDDGYRITIQPIPGATGTSTFMLYATPDNGSRVLLGTSTQPSMTVELAPGRRYTLDLEGFYTGSPILKARAKLALSLASIVIRFNGITEASAASDTSANITWAAAAGRVDTYVVTATGEPTGPKTKTVAARDGNGNPVTSTVFIGLTRDTLYEMRVNACRVIAGQNFCDTNFVTLPVLTFAYKVPTFSGVTGTANVTGPNAVSRMNVDLGAVSWPTDVGGSPLCAPGSQRVRVFAWEQGAESFNVGRPVDLTVSASDPVLGDYVSTGTQTVEVRGLSSFATLNLQAGRTYCFRARAGCTISGSFVQEENTQTQCRATLATPPPPVDPTIASVVPGAVQVNQSVLVTISGTGFQSGATVNYGPILNVATTFVSSGTLTFASPALATPQFINLTVNNPDGGTATRPQAVEVTNRAAPTISSVVPSSGPTSGGNQVVINGTGFRDTTTPGATANMAITFDGRTCSNVVLQGTQQGDGTYLQARCLVPGLPPGVSAGSVAVRAENYDGQSGTRPNAYTYVPAPTLTAVTPNQMPLAGGQPIVLTGTNFRAGATVLVGGILNCTNVTLLSATQIQCDAPSVAIQGDYSVTIRNPDTQQATLNPGITYVGPPTIDQVIPAGGAVAGGTNITIVGTGFQTGASIFVGPAQASSVTFVDSATLTATTAPWSAGTYDVRVVNPDGQFAEFPAAFEYAENPTIATITPNIGATAGGYSVTLTGTFLTTTAGCSSLRIGSVNVPSGNITSCAADSISFIMPSSAAGTAIVDVRVQNTYGQAVTRTNFFSYSDFPNPTVSAINNDHGRVNTAQPGRVITGTNFRNGAQVFFEWGSTRYQATSVVVNGPTQITCTTPALPLLSGTNRYDVIVRNNDLREGELVTAYRVLNIPAPTVTGISPRFSATAGGISATISGTNFFPNPKPRVFIGSTQVAPANVGTVTAGTAQITVPAGTAGLRDVTVQNADDQQSTLVNGFSYTNAPAPTITSMDQTTSPTAGGVTRLINGTNFTTGAQIEFFVGATNYAVAGPTFVNASQYSVAMPALPALPGGQRYSIRITLADYQTAVLNDVLLVVDLPPPTISSLSPSYGPPAGGTSVTFTGLNFQSGAIARINNVNCASTTFNSTTSLTCITPAGVTGNYTVSVFNPDFQEGTLPSGWTYTGTPSITSNSPTLSGWRGGGTLTVNGDLFLPGAAVRLRKSVSDFQACTGVVVAPNGKSLTCTLPEYRMDTFDLEVENPDAQTASRNTAITYRPGPQMHNVNPSAGLSTAGGQQVTIFGANFFSGTQAFITNGSGAEIPCTSTLIDSEWQIRCVTPARTAGRADLIVRNNNDSQWFRMNQVLIFGGNRNYNTVTPVAGAISAQGTLGITDGAFGTNRLGYPMGGAVYGGEFIFAEQNTRTLRAMSLVDGTVRTIARPINHPVDPFSSRTPCQGVNVTTPWDQVTFGTPRWVAVVRNLSVGPNFVDYLFVWDETCGLYRSTLATKASAGADVPIGATPPNILKLAQNRHAQVLGMISDNARYLYLANWDSCVIERFDATTTSGVPRIVGPAAGGNCGGTISASTSRQAAVWARTMGMAFDGTFLYLLERDNKIVRRVDLSGAQGDPGTVNIVAGQVGVTPPSFPMNGDGVGTAALLTSPIHASFIGGFIYFFDERTIRRMNTTTFLVESVSSTYNDGAYDARNGGGYVDDTAARSQNPHGTWDRSFLVAHDDGLGGYLITTVADGYRRTAIRMLDLEPNIADMQMYTMAGKANDATWRSAWTGATLTPVGTRQYVDGTGESARFNFGFSMVALNNLLYFNDENNRIRFVDPTVGQVQTINVTGISTGLNFQFALAVDNTGYIYVADRHNHRIVRVDASTGIARVLAGPLTGTASGYVDSTTPNSARFRFPWTMTTDGRRLYFHCRDASDNQTLIRAVEVDTGITTTFAGAAGNTTADPTTFVGQPVANLRGRGESGIAINGNELYISWDNISGLGNRAVVVDLSANTVSRALISTNNSMRHMVPIGNFIWAADNGNTFRYHDLTGPAGNYVTYNNLQNASTWGYNNYAYSDTRYIGVFGSRALAHMHGALYFFSDYHGILRLE
jgi:hypothetical protein